MTYMYETLGSMPLEEPLDPAFTYEIAEDRGIRFIKFGLVKYSTYNHRTIARVLRMKTKCKIKTVYVYSFAPKQ